uniref:Uncharacterized protein n=1 Tax=Rhizophora mucronata TaxID=61149 RepID=A0A2P2P1G1_RHIMU
MRYNYKSSGLKMQKPVKSKSSLVMKAISTTSR